MMFRTQSKLCFVKSTIMHKLSELINFLYINSKLSDSDADNFTSRFFPSRPSNDIINFAKMKGIILLSENIQNRYIINNHGYMIMKNIRTRFIFTLIFIFFSIIGWSQTPYTTNGTFTAPAGVTSIKVECWGAGGGGSTITANGRRGGGGGGGAYASSIVTVIPGNTYLVVVGGGGSANNTGGNSSFNDTVVVAAGGNGGTNNAATAGAGGTDLSSTGVIKYSGGIGANGGGTWSGGGGGGAGKNGAGGNASGATAGTGTTINGGNGGSGVNNSNDGQIGNNYGGGGSGACTNSNTDRIGGNGANGYVIITLPSNILLASPSPIATANVLQGTAKLEIFSFATTVTTSNATINSVSFTTAGTYIASDVSKFQLWYSTTNNIATAAQIGSDVTTSLGTGIHTFSGLTQVTNSGTIGYFWITTDILSTATAGATISVNAFTTTNLTYEIAIITGSAVAGGTQTILPVPNIAITSLNPAVPSANVNQGTIDQPVYSFSTAITNTSATLNSVTFTTTGTYVAADITRFKLWYNTTNNIATAFQIGPEIIGTLGTGPHTFSGLSQTTNSGSTGYFWITVNIASFPVNGRTIAVNAITTGNLTYTLGIKSGTTNNGGTQTIQTLNGIILSSTNPAVSAASILQGSVKQRIHKFTTIISITNRTINSVSFTTTGTYVATDVVNFKLWYNTVNSLVSAAQLGTTITTGLGTGTHTFSGLAQTTNAGNTGYFWITADMAAGAVSGHTLTVNALTSANLTYSSGTVTGSTYAGGIQTVLVNINNDSDGAADIYDLDDDNDGIPDVDENNPCNSSVVELFPNSNFDAGNTGFTTGYTYASGPNSLYPEGTYTVINNAFLVHDHFANCSAGHGNMMVVNGSPNPNLIVWRSGSIAVTPNTDYTLSINLTSVNPGNPSQLIFNVNGENIGSQFNATSTNCQWVNAQATWNSGSNTFATFDIVNLNLILGGNDFAIDNVSCTYRINCDSDGDGVPDKLDIDSDNDGIYDVVEAGGTDANNDGIIDSYATDADLDGLADNVDNVNSGSGGGEVISGTPLLNSDTDADALPNRIDIDSDNDLCYDTKEAGFADNDNDGKLGNSPVAYNVKGKVTSAVGYTDPANLDGPGNTIKDYIQQVPYITTQPVSQIICVSTPTNTSFTVVANNAGGTYQWQVSTDNGSNWSNLTNTGVYSTVTTATLNLTNVPSSYDGYLYKVLLSHPAYVCSPLISSVVTLRAFGSVPATPGAITGNTVVCPAVNSTYTILAVPKALSYTWNVPAGWSVTSGAGTTSISATSAASSSGNITVTASNTCGTSPVSTLLVSVSSPTPTFTAPSVASICQSVDVTYTTETGKSNYVWSVTTGSLGSDYTITSGGTSTDNSFTLKWLTTGNKTVTVNYTSGGCSGTVASKTLNVISNAIITVQPVNPPAMCAGAGSNAISVTAIGSVTGYQWQVSTDGGSNWNNISNTAPYSNVTTNTMTITNPPAGLNNAQYHCLVTGSCGAVTSNAATLTVNGTVIISQSTATQTKCIGGSFAPISVTASGASLSYQWYSNTTATIIGGTALGASNGAQTDTYTLQATISDTLYYYCIVGGTCGSATSVISGAIIVSPLPVPVISGATENCEEATLTLDAGVGFSSYAWNIGAVNLGNTQTQIITTQSLTAPVNSVVETYTVVVTNVSGCSGSDTHTITVYRNPDTGPQYHIINNNNP
jgi:hypothetical protein